MARYSLFVLTMSLNTNLLFGAVKNSSHCTVVSVTVHWMSSVTAWTGTAHIVWGWEADCSRLVVMRRQRSCLQNCCASVVRLPMSVRVSAERSVHIRCHNMAGVTTRAPVHEKHIMGVPVYLFVQENAESTPGQHFSLSPCTAGSICTLANTALYKFSRFVTIFPM